MSLRPWAWAVLRRDGRWAAGEIRDPSDDPARALRDALSAAGVRERAVALAIPMKPVVWDLIPGLRPGSRQARRAATMAAAVKLRADPRQTVVSLDGAPGGVTYVGAERASIEALMAPWLAQGFSVPVVEPAAVSLLRGVGSDDPVVVVRLGLGEADIIAGSRHRLLFARRLPLAGGGAPLPGLQLEITSTIESARKEHGQAISRVLLSWWSGAEVAPDAASGGLGRVELHPGLGPGGVPGWAVGAASVSLWRAAGRGGSSRPWAGIGALRRVLSTRWIGRREEARREA
jgi:hypothetical protein